MSKMGCFIKVKEPGVAYYLPIPGGRIVSFISKVYLDYEKNKQPRLGLELW